MVCQPISLSPTVETCSSLTAFNRSLSRVQVPDQSPSSSGECPLSRLRRKAPPIFLLAITSSTSGIAIANNNAQHCRETCQDFMWDLSFPDLGGIDRWHCCCSILAYVLYIAWVAMMWAELNYNAWTFCRCPR